MAAPGKALIRTAFITVSIAWGTTYVGMHVAVESLKPLDLGAIRFILAGVVLMLILRLRGIALPTAREWPWMALIGCVLLTGANSFLSYGGKYLPSVLISLLVNLGPLVYLTLARLTGEAVSRRAWGGLVIGIAGLLLLLFPRLEQLASGVRLDEPVVWQAIGVVLLAPIFWSVGCLISARRKLRCHPLMSAAAQTFCGGVGALVLALAAGSFRVWPAVTSRSWWAVGWLVVVGTWLGYVSYVYCLQTMRSSSIAMITYLNTVTALVAGWLVLGERPTPLMLCGGAVMLAGVALAQSARLTPALARTSTDARG